MVELPRSVPTYKVTDFCASAPSPLRLSLVSGVLLCFKRENQISYWLTSNLLSARDAVNPPYLPNIA